MSECTLANEFYTVWKTGETIPVPPSTRFENFNMEAAYEVESAFARMREESGHRTAGRKVGYANKAMWRVLKLETLVWAHMYDDTVHYAEDGRATLSLGRWKSAKIEPEIVFKLRGPGGSMESVEWMAIGFEIIVCPYPDWQFKPADFVAAFGLHAALVVGMPQPVDLARVEELGRFKLTLLRNGELVEEGSGKNSLRSPALCLEELGRVAQLAAGEVISTGTLTAAQPVAVGETWKVEVDTLSLQSLTLQFT